MWGDTEDTFIRDQNMVAHFIVWDNLRGHKGIGDKEKPLNRENDSGVFAGLVLFFQCCGQTKGMIAEMISEPFKVMLPMKGLVFVLVFAQADATT